MLVLGNAWPILLQALATGRQEPGQSCWAHLARDSPPHRAKGGSMPGAGVVGRSPVPAASVQPILEAFPACGPRGSLTSVAHPNHSCHLSNTYYMLGFTVGQSIKKTTSTFMMGLFPPVYRYGS